jgi:dynein light chain roadblock-type
MSEVEETLNRMQTHKNVQGIVIVNNEGVIIRSTYTNERKEEGISKIIIGNALARLIPQLISKAKNTIRDLDAHNDLKFMRLKTTNY